FIALADVVDPNEFPDAVLSFSKTWGILNLGVEYLDADMTPLPDAGPWSISGRQPIQTWSRLAKWALAIRTLSSYLSRSEIPSPIEWEWVWDVAATNAYVVGREDPWGMRPLLKDAAKYGLKTRGPDYTTGDMMRDIAYSTGKDTSPGDDRINPPKLRRGAWIMAGAGAPEAISQRDSAIRNGRAEIARMLNMWVQIGKPSLSCQWDYGSGPVNVRFGANGLMAALTMSLIADVAEARYWAVCHYCAHLYKSLRSPAPGGRHYCPEHQGLANKIALYEARERKRLERLAGVAPKLKAGRSRDTVASQKRKAGKPNGRKTDQKAKGKTAARKKPTKTRKA
ncbi:MAG TPA: hypothetical protein VI756_23215, partial [Blastocatellia bacterium]